MKTKKSKDKEIYEYLEELGGYADYNDKIESLMEDFGLNKETAEGYVWNYASGLYKIR